MVCPRSMEKRGSDGETSYSDRGMAGAGTNDKLGNCLLLLRG